MVEKKYSLKTLQIEIAKKFLIKKIVVFNAINMRIIHFENNPKGMMTVSKNHSNNGITKHVFIVIL